MKMTSQFSDMGLLSNFFDVVLFFLSILVTGLSFMPTSSLVLELWQFSFIRDCPEIRKLEMAPSEFCPISGDWRKLGITNLARISLIKFNWKLRNSRVTVLTVFELLRENQQEVNFTPSPPRLGLSTRRILCWKIFTSERLFDINLADPIWN